MHEQTKHYHLGCGEALDAVHTSTLKNRKFESDVKRLLDKKLDKRNFRRKVQKLKSVIPLEEKQRGVLHKPARLFIYDKDQVEDED